MTPDSTASAGSTTPRPRLQVITASTRPGRKGPLVAEWFRGQARRHEGFEIEPVDLAAVDLPVFDEPRHPRLQDYEHDHTRAWSQIVERADAFVVVTPEYDHSPPSSLVNAFQFLVKEWAYKPMGFVSYGGVSGGTRSAEVIKLIATTLRIMPIPEAVSIPFFAKKIDERGVFEPGEVQEKASSAMLDELLRWTQALRTLRKGGD